MQATTSLEPADVEAITAALSRANKAFAQHYPGESDRRQAVHTVYGGAHLFRADTARRLGDVALRSLNDYAPDAATLVSALGLTNDSTAEKLYGRITEKLQREPVE